MVPLAAGRIIRANTIQKPRMPLGAAGTWSPPASQIFFAKSESITPVSDGTAVNSWADQTANAYNLSAFGTAPQYFNGIQNGFGGVRFSTSGNALQCACPADSASFTFCSVIKFSDLGPTVPGVIFECQSGTGANSLDMFQTHLRLVKSGISVIGTSAFTFSTGVWYAVVATYDGTSHNYAFYVNSGTVDSSGNWSGATSFTAGALTRIGRTSGSSAPLGADILELRKGNAVWASSDISGFITTYARPKYGF